MTGCERILARLEQGPASAAELYALGVMVHSRVADLRKRGHDIRCEHIDGMGTGTEAFEYRLLDGGFGRVDAAEPSIERADSGGELRLSVRSTTSAPSGGHSPSATPSRAVDDAGLAHGPGVLGAEVPGQLTIEVAA